MNTIIIAFGTQILVFTFLFIVGKYLLPKAGIDSVDKLDKAINEYEFINNYAQAFVSWAKEFMPKASGTEKMGAVINKLVPLVEQFNINMDRTTLMAITQQAYNIMKAGLASNEYNKIIIDKNNAAHNNINISPEITV